MHRAGRWLSLILTVAACWATQAVRADEPRPSAPTSSGAVVGLYAGNVAEFLGIPYAAPPIGDLRWRPPAAPDPWTDPRLSISFANHCVQDQAGQFAKPSITEDCLYLNVFTPRDFASKPGGRPVLVWLYGGGVVAGESEDYDGAKLAGFGDAVLVSVNYRVGTLGFFAHPALDAEGHTNGNYGLMDIQAALKWVQANIARFGGDPKRVTIFGQSGGATVTMATLVSPTAAGLFHRVINESGTHIVSTPIADAEKLGESFAAKAGCSQNAAACLRALSPARIVATAVPPVSFFIQDGTTITEPPYRSFESGHFNHVPIMTGLVADEQSFFLPEVQGGSRQPLTAAQLDAFVASFGAQNKDAILQSYPPSSYASPSLADIAIAEGNKACTARRFDQLWSRYVPVYAYLFDQEDTPSYLPKASYPTRAYHTSELLYLFPLFHGGQGQPHLLDAAQEKLSDRMVRYWTNFAATGNPNGKEAVQAWKPYDPKDDDINHITAAESTMADKYGAQTYPFNRHNDCAMWDRLNAYEWVPSLR